MYLFLRGVGASRSDRAVSKRAPFYKCVYRRLDEPWAQPKKKCALDSLAGYIVWAIWELKREIPAESCPRVIVRHDGLRLRGHC